MEKWGSGSSPGREEERRGRTGVEWKLAPHYLQQLVHSLMIKCWSSICDKSVCMYACVCKREGAYVCILTYVHCVCLIPLYTTLKISLVCALGEKCHALMCFCLSEDYDLRGVCCSGRGSHLTQGWGAGKKSWAELCYSPLPLTPVLRSVIFVIQRELTHTNTSSLFSLPLLGSRGQTVSWELESQ